MTDAARAANALTERWAATLDDGPTVLSGAGVWPLLALLLPGADGDVRAELAAAVGLDAAASAAAARELLDALAAEPGLRAALGLWLVDGVPLVEAWAALLPPGARGALTRDEAVDRAALDGWAAEHTGGLIERMPVTLGDPYPDLVLASALAVKVEWREHFTEWGAAFETGPWAGPTRYAVLQRSGTDLDDLAVATTPAGPLTVLTVRAREEVDVHLLLAEPDRRAGEVLAAGVGAVGGAYPATRGSVLAVGATAPGVVVAEVESRNPQDLLRVATVRFRVDAEHDLIPRAGLFGLAAAVARGGGFTGVTPLDLAIGQARQAAMATFGPKGFEAAAVTAMGMAAGSAPPTRLHRVRDVRVRFDRPFGFLATHRPTGLVLVAGWVTEPATWTD